MPSHTSLLAPRSSIEVSATCQERTWNTFRSIRGIAATFSRFYGDYGTGHAAPPATVHGYKGVTNQLCPFMNKILGANGVKQVLKEGFDIVELRPQGAIGSACGILFRNWVETALNGSKAARIVKGLLMPVWILFSLTVNSLTMIVDVLDQTQDFYHNMFSVAKKKCD